MSADLEEAWNAVHDATPAGWYVGRPSYHSERREWVQYAFDPSWDRRSRPVPLVDRSIHRTEHLDEIEAVLG